MINLCGGVEVERVDGGVGRKEQSAQEGETVSGKKRKSERGIFMQHLIQASLSLGALDAHIKCYDCLTFILYHDFY